MGSNLEAQKKGDSHFGRRRRNSAAEKALLMYGTLISGKGYVSRSSRGKKNRPSDDEISSKEGGTCPRKRVEEVISRNRKEKYIEGEGEEFLVGNIEEGVLCQTEESFSSGKERRR